MEKIFKVLLGIALVSIKYYEYDLKCWYAHSSLVALDFGDVSGKLAMRSALIYLTPKVDWVLQEFEILWQHLWIISN